MLKKISILFAGLFLSAAALSDEFTGVVEAVKACEAYGNSATDTATLVRLKADDGTTITAFFHAGHASNRNHDSNRKNFFAIMLSHMNFNSPVTITYRNETAQDYCGTSTSNYIYAVSSGTF